MTSYEVREHRHPPGWRVIRKVEDSPTSTYVTTVAVYADKVWADQVADHLTRYSEGELEQ